ncbi:MAG: (Fe-S)-binding protein [Desulfobacterium sp.]|nr:(Fe-S)-binding protein [Desulfobacterium sp.]
MEIYTIVKALLMACLLSAGFGYFYIRVRRLVNIMQSVKGDRSPMPDRIGERIKVLATDILGQSNVRRKYWPGLAHTFIFFGFLAVQPHSLELMVQGIFPSFSVAHMFPGFFTVYLATADALAFFVLMGLGYGLYRRLVVKPDYLTNGNDAKFIILFTSVIILTFHFYNAFHMVMPSDGFDYGACFSFSAILSSMLGLSDLSLAAKTTGLELSYWIHMLTIVGFMIYIPGSKHLHLLAGIPNVFYKPLDVEKAMIKTDIEDEDAETFGLSKVSEFDWKHVLDLYSCTECGRCEERCPAHSTGKPLSPKEIIHEAKLELFEHAETLMAEDGDLETIPLLVGDDGARISKDALWACTSCRGCEDICPVNIQHLDIILEARKFQVLMEADFPPELQDTFTNLENQSNPWGFSADTRANWCKDLDVPLMRDNPDADILYFVGCAGSYDDRGIKTSRAIVSILKKAGVNFAILGDEERCNGDMARRCGNEYLAQTMIQENVETLNQYKPKKILTGCPHCFNTIKNEYPQFGAKYEVVHHTDFILELLEEGRLKTSGKDFGKITFHDSCYLGRWNNIYESPREVLKRVNYATKVVEMEKHGDNGMCCGAGGGRMFMEEDIGKRINNERALEAMATGADIVTAACPFCITMLSDGIKDSGKESNMEVKDLAEIVDEATL